MTSVLDRVRAMILDALSHPDQTPEPYIPVIENGHARISDPEQIHEPHCDVSTKDGSEQYLGIHSGAIYTVVPPWELDG